MLNGQPHASIHGGLRDVISDGMNGLLMHHNDVTQLTQAVVRLVGMMRRRGVT